MRERSRQQLVLPILLIAAGVLLFLDQMDVWQVPWGALLHFWPMLLVLVGLEMILGRTRTGSIVILVLVLGLVAAGAAYLAPRLERASGATRQLSHPRGAARSANVALQFAVGDVTVSALEPGSEALYVADVRYDPARTTLTADVTGGGDEVRVSLRSSQTGLTWAPGTASDRWDVRLSPEVPLRLEIQGGVNASRFDLSGLRLSRLDAKMGVGEATLILSERAPYEANIDCGVGRLTVQVPAEVPARIRVNAGLGAVRVDSRLRREGNDYVTEGYETNAAAIVVDIDGGVGEVVIR